MASMNSFSTFPAPSEMEREHAPPRHRAGSTDEHASGRRALHRSGLGLVEDALFAPRHPAPTGHSAEYQLVLPYRGFFSWSVGQVRTLLDANQILFVGAGEDYAETHPVAGLGHSSAVITPQPAMLDELCGRAGARRHSAFREMSRPATARTRLIAHQLLHLQRHEQAGSLEGDELALAALRTTLAEPERRNTAAPRIVDAAKGILHANGRERLALEDIAGQIGVSPVYLTQAFAQSEGLPLYRYQTRLRLSQALVALPDCDDIMGLALDLGFSSHSHFSAAFKATFGLTPSSVRKLGARARRDLRAISRHYP